MGLGLSSEPGAKSKEKENPRNELQLYEPLPASYDDLQFEN